MGFFSREICGGKYIATSTISLEISVYCCFTENYVKSTNRIRFRETKEVGTYEIGAGEEFLLADTDITILSEEISGNFKEAELVCRDGTHMELFVTMENVSGSIELPLFAYKGYCVTDEQGIEYVAGAGSNNRLQIELPAGYTGKIYIDFHAPWYWRLAEIVSIVWLALIVVYRIFFLKTGKNSGYEEKSFL